MINHPNRSPRTLAAVIRKLAEIADGATMSDYARQTLFEQIAILTSLRG